MVEEYAASESLNLPVFPRVAQELHEKMADEKSSVSDIASVITKDQALASQMLKLANSAFFAGLNRVRTIREAIMRLGVNQVYNCLIACSQKELYISHDKVIGEHLHVLWKHSLATAKGSQWLLRKIGFPELSDEGFLAGLFHDIGKLLLLKVLETIRIEYQDISLSESFTLELLDSMHVEQGYVLMTEWSIPPVYCEVAKHHHDEGIDSEDALLYGGTHCRPCVRKDRHQPKAGPNDRYGDPARSPRDVHKRRRPGRTRSSAGRRPGH